MFFFVALFNVANKFATPVAGAIGLSNLFERNGGSKLLGDKVHSFARLDSTGLLNNTNVGNE